MKAAQNSSNFKSYKILFLRGFHFSSHKKNRHTTADAFLNKKY